MFTTDDMTVRLVKGGAASVIRVLEDRFEYARRVTMGCVGLESAAGKVRAKQHALRGLSQALIEVETKAQMDAWLAALPPWLAPSVAVECCNLAAFAWDSLDAHRRQRDTCSPDTRTPA